MASVELIVAALAAGAGSGVSDVASKAVGDAYTGLKALLARRLVDWPQAAAALAEDEADPQVWQVRLGEELARSGAAADAEVLASAHHLLGLVDASATATFPVDASRARGVQVGNHNTQTNTF
jgi:hypothetical protein